MLGKYGEVGSEGYLVEIKNTNKSADIQSAPN